MMIRDICLAIATDIHTRGRGKNDRPKECEVLVLLLVAANEFGCLSFISSGSQKGLQGRVIRAVLGNAPEAVMMETW